MGSTIKEPSAAQMADGPGNQPTDIDWMSLFAYAEHWQSDLKFFDAEMRFLKGVFDRCLLALIDEQHLEYTRLLVGRLLELEKSSLLLVRKLNAYLCLLANFPEGDLKALSRLQMHQHQELQQAMEDLERAFRAIKKEIFHLTEQVICADKTKHLLSSQC